MNFFKLKFNSDFNHKKRFKTKKKFNFSNFFKTNCFSNKISIFSFGKKEEKSQLTCRIKKNFFSCSIQTQVPNFLQKFKDKKKIFFMSYSKLKNSIHFNNKKKSESLNKLFFFKLTNFSFSTFTSLIKKISFVVSKSSLKKFLGSKKIFFLLNYFFFMICTWILFLLKVLWTQKFI